MWTSCLTLERGLKLIVEMVVSQYFQRLMVRIEFIIIKKDSKNQESIPNPGYQMGK